MFSVFAFFIICLTTNSTVLLMVILAEDTWSQEKGQWLTYEGEAQHGIYTTRLHCNLRNACILDMDGNLVQDGFSLYFSGFLNNDGHTFFKELFHFTVHSFKV